MAIDYTKEGKVAIFTLNHPEALNAVTPDEIAQWSESLMEFRDDDSLLVAIVTGSGQKAFCAGADIKTMLPFMQATAGHPHKRPPTIMRGLKMWKPMVAAVNGIAVGGGLEIVLACDIRIAAENAMFGVPEVTLGLIPGWGGTQRLPRVIPWSKAAEMLLTGRPIDAQEAYRVGLVNKVVPQAQLMEEAKKMAELLCRPGPLAVRAAKQAMHEGMSVDLESGLEIEELLEDYCLKTEDFAEGSAAFTEKRRPNFKGK
jgi:enoyl-CoA hydratase/carnithine racemase